MLPFILPTSNPLPFSQYHHDHHTFFVANWRITNCGSRSKIKNPLTLVCLPRQMLSKMVCHDTGALMATGKGLYACPVPAGGDWAQVLPTQWLPGTNQTTPENFAWIGPSVQKLFRIFQNTDTQTNHPFTVYGYRLIFCPVFLPFHSLRLLALLPHSISFTIISFKSTLIKVISKWPATRFAATLTEKNNRPTRLKLAEFRKYLNFSNKKLKSYPGSTPTQCAGEPVTVEIVCTDQGQVHMLATTQPSPKCFF